MLPRFGLAPLGFLEIAPPDFIALAAATGFTSVNLRTRAAVPGGQEFPMRVGDEGVRACRRRIADTGVTVRQIEQVGLDRTLDVSALRPMLEAGAELGVASVLCSGDDPDLALVADRFGALCQLAREFGMAVELEFMPFRALKTLTDAIAVLIASAADNGRVCVDALHLFRSGGKVAGLRAVDPGRLGSLQLADAPLTPPPPHRLAEEARERRCLPGQGELPLEELLAAWPADHPIDAEIPMLRAVPDPGALARARLIAAAMRDLLGRRRAPA